MSRYGASELMRYKKLHKRAVNYGINKLTPFIQSSVGTAMDQLSTKVRPNIRYKTGRKDLDGRSGRGIDPMTVVKKAPDIAMKTTQELIPSLKPVYDRYKSGDIMKSAFGSEQGITSSKFWRRPTAAEEKKMGIIKKGSNPELFFKLTNGGRQYKSKFFEKNPEALIGMNNITGISSNPDTWPPIIREKYGIIVDEHFWENNPLSSFGSGIDIHKAILKVAPRKGFTLPGHKYTGPGNPLDSRLKYDPQTGDILEIYEQPTGRTDAVSMQHDVDYSVCGNKPTNEEVKCKNEADRKMIKALDAIPWKQRRWGHAMARTMINTKQKLGLGLQKKRASALSSDWSQQLAHELHKPITRNFKKRSVISNGIDEIWAADLVEMQKFSKWNKGIKYLLMVIDVCSKYGWIRGLKDKKTETVSKAFDEIFKSKRKPQMLWKDKGSEFISKHFKDFLKKEGIKLYHTENEEKSSVVERWNKTMKNKM